MTELVIRYAISTRLKLQAIIASVYLMVVSIVISVLQLMDSQYNILFFVGVIGFLIALSLLLSSTISQPKPLIRINNDEFEINFPKQRLNTTLYWNEVSHIGIGLSFITLLIEEEEVKIDLEILRYHDLKVLKAKLIEVAEAKTIPYNNL